MSNFIPYNRLTFNQGSPAFDGFGRVRTGQPLTLFDSKLLHDKSPFFWDEATVSGSGFVSTHLPDESAVEITSDGTVGQFVRQTFQRFNYQPGKSHAIFLTGVLDPEGIGEFEVVRRSSVTGSVVDEVVGVDDMNGRDNPQGYGNEEINIDRSKTQIFTIDMEWLGVGQVRTGIVRNGQPFTIHYFRNDNLSDQVYMANPNLPVRYEIEVTATEVITRMGYFDDNDGVFFQSRAPKAAQSIKCICSTVISEGGQQDTGVLRYETTGGTQLDANSVGTIYALIGIRLKSTHKNVGIKLVRKTVLAETLDDFEWLLIFNPTVAGTFTYSGLTDSAVETAKGDTTNTITGGTILDGGFVQGNSAEPTILSNALKLGAAIDGTMDEIVLCVRPLSVNLDIQGGLTWRELI